MTAQKHFGAAHRQFGTVHIRTLFSLFVFQKFDISTRLNEIEAGVRINNILANKRNLTLNDLNE